jgi:hypothetical protein
MIRSQASAYLTETGRFSRTEKRPPEFQDKAPFLKKRFQLFEIAARAGGLLLRDELAQWVEVNRNTKDRASPPDLPRRLLRIYASDTCKNIDPNWCDADLIRKISSGENCRSDLLPMTADLHTT